MNQLASCLVGYRLFDIRLLVDFVPLRHRLFRMALFLHTCVQWVVFGPSFGTASVQDPLFVRSCNTLNATLNVLLGLLLVL